MTTKTTAERIAAIDSQIAKAAEKLNTERELLKLLPAELAIASFCVHNSSVCDASIKFEVEHRADVLPILALLPAEPLALLKGTFTSFRPEPLTEKEESENRVTQVQPWTFKLEGGRRYGPNRVIEWKHRAAGKLFDIDVEVKQDPARVYGVPKSTRGFGANIIEKWDFNPADFPGAQSITYWTGRGDDGGSDGYHVQFFWFRDASLTLAEVLQINSEVKP